MGKKTKAALALKEALDQDQEESPRVEYIKNTGRGYRRQKVGRGFVYFDEKNKKITDEKILQRIRGLGIPPAYNKVWICPNPNGHIQAIGRDIKNRKQYVYHPHWVKERQDQKFKSLLHFGRALAKIRKIIQDEVQQPPQLTKVQIICVVLFFIDKYSVRVGNINYAKTNKTYGITTLRKTHIYRDKKQFYLKFLGKNKHPWNLPIEDPYILKILQECEKLPGREIFKYYNENQELTVITSNDINEFLDTIDDNHFTAKDFRTWIATREYFKRMLLLVGSKKVTLKQLRSILVEVATLLGHTPAICKSSYVHPELLQCLQNGSLKQWHRKNKHHLKKGDVEKLLLLWLECIYKE
ncbi:MAG: DNA topoisomerase IB [Legionella sp.]|nr:DNA topoisomerase IB [Legionella sp.]